MKSIAARFLAALPLTLPLTLLLQGGAPSYADAQAGGDPCEFIRQAILALPDTGGLVKIPAGTFNCQSKIVIKKSHVQMAGAGTNDTILRLADQSPAPVLVIGDDQVVLDSTGNFVVTHRVSDIEVSDLTVDGNVAHQDVTKECGNGTCDGNPLDIRNNAITIRGASYVTLSRVTAHSSISGGLVTEKYCDHLHVQDFTSYDNHFDGFAGYQTHDSRFENMNLSRNHGAGISIDIDFNKNYFLGGVLASNGDVGIFMRDSSDDLFENLIITKSGNHGIFLADSGHPDSCATGNEFRSIVVNGSKGDGIDIASPTCVGNSVTGDSVLTGNSQACYQVNPATTMVVGSNVTCRP